MIISLNLAIEFQTVVAVVAAVAIVLVVKYLFFGK